MFFLPFCKFDLLGLDEAVVGLEWLKIEVPDIIMMFDVRLIVLLFLLSSKYLQGSETFLAEKTWYKLAELL